MTQQPSPRALVQQRIEDHLNQHRRTWSAPYGVLPSTRALPRGGAVRLITFGQARYLDATIAIWSPTRIEVEGSGPRAYAVVGTFGSVDELLERLAETEEIVEGRAAPDAPSATG